MYFLSHFSQSFAEVRKVQEEKDQVLEEKRYKMKQVIVEQEKKLEEDKKVTLRVAHDS